MNMLLPVLWLVLGAVGMSGCTTPVPYDPFLGKGSQFTNAFHVVAISPLFVPTNNPNAILAKQTIEATTEQLLRDAGLTVIPALEVEPIQKKLIEQLGGLFDSTTGNPDQGKIDAYIVHCREQLASTYHSDAVAFLALRAITVPFTHSDARWHGVRESVVPDKGFGRFLATPVDGTAPALSLLVVLEDMTGVEIYINWGGIQLLSKVAGMTFHPLPDTEILADQTLNTNAVNIALSPLLEKIKAAAVSTP